MAAASFPPVQASPDEPALDPDSPEALWQEMERALEGPPLPPRCALVLRMVRLHCASLCQSQADVLEVWSAESAVEEFAGSSIVEPIKEITRHLVWSVQEESATGPMEVHLRTSSAMRLERAHSLCELQLAPQLGWRHAEAVLCACHDCAWAEQRRLRQPLLAQVHELWCVHRARSMGFAEPFDSQDAASSGAFEARRAVLALCYRLCRHWTCANVRGGGLPSQQLPLREAELEIAMELARESVPQEELDAIVSMQKDLRRSTHLVRLTDRKNPATLVLNLLQNVNGQGRAAFLAAQATSRERLAPLLGAERAEEAFWMCHACAWHEQNRYDYESAIGGRVTGAREGYLRDCRTDWQAVQEHSQKAGF